MADLETSDFVLRCIQTGAIILGGGYTLFEYLRFRRLSPKLQFDIDFDLYPIDMSPGDYLLNIRLIVKNMGHVRKKFPHMFVGVKTLTTDAVKKGLKSQKRLLFERSLIKGHNIVHNPDDPWWVDSGITQIFPYPVVIHEPDAFIQVNAKIFYYKYRKKTDFHQASCIKPVATEIKLVPGDR